MRGLYGIIDTSASPGRDHLELAGGFLSGGARWLQLRAKGAGAEEVEALLVALLPLAKGSGATWIVNDHVEVAARHPGVGAHIGQDDLDPREARRILGPGRLLGLSTGSTEEVAAAPPCVDYLGFGPVFTAAGKHRARGDARTVARPRGIDGLKAALRVATVPLVAIGGIDRGNIGAVVSAGAPCAAVLSAVTAAPDPAGAARALQRAFER